MRRAAGLVLLLALALPAASAGGGELEPEHARLLRALDRATPGARAGDPELVQARYDAARALSEALRTVPGCAALRRYAALSVAAAEAFDRLRPAGGIEVAAGRMRSRAGSERCPGPAPPDERTGGTDELLEPLSGEAFFGTVRSRAPSRARSAVIRLDGTLLAVRPAAGSRELVARIVAPAAAGSLEVRFLDAGARVRARGRAADVIALTAAAEVAGRPPRRDASLAGRLETAVRAFPGVAAVWVHDLATGRSAGIAEDVRFPAASTVKLGVLAAALDRFGPRPERSPAAHDLEALAAWSSNLAANRLLVLLGAGDERRGVVVVEERLRRLGARSSSYPGTYRAGTSRSAMPPATGRVTTARDLGRVLAVLHAAAVGRTSAARRAGLSRHEARVGLALLLASERRGDNAGLLGLPDGVPAAQKHGWTSSTRHSAAIVYGAAGPTVVVLLTYADGLQRSAARRLGTRVAEIATG